jgi:hypothetical protein
MENIEPITLRFQEKSFSLFKLNQDSDTLLFGEDYEPLVLEISLNNEQDHYNKYLYDCSLAYFILELKEILQIGQVDISLEFPQLELVVHQVA